MTSLYSVSSKFKFTVSTPGGEPFPSTGFSSSNFTLSLLLSTSIQHKYISTKQSKYANKSIPLKKNLILKNLKIECGTHCVRCLLRTSDDFLFRCLGAGCQMSQMFCRMAGGWLGVWSWYIRVSVVTSR